MNRWTMTTAIFSTYLQYSTYNSRLVLNVTLKYTFQHKNHLLAFHVLIPNAPLILFYALYLQAEAVTSDILTIDLL